MSNSKSIYTGKARITYYDLDLRGRVKLSALLRMVHIAADINANDIGVGFKVLSGLNMSFVLQRFGLAINRMPAYNEELTIRTWPGSMERGTFLRKGDMYDENGNKLMEWTSMWILFDLAARKILKPSALPVLIEGAGEQGVSIQPKKIILPQDASESGRELFSYTHTVRYAEVDTNIHMNNSIYGDLIGNALFPTTETAAPPWREVQINYLSETRLGEQIEVSARQNGDSFLVTGQASGRNAFAATIVTG
ncbi:MAG: thioesterase [Defluviitaleaceae bacterium]|nr:thioesterase [Defluviitaleaceae bacterium]